MSTTLVLPTTTTMLSSFFFRRGVAEVRRTRDDGRILRKRIDQHGPVVDVVDVAVSERRLGRSVDIVDT